MSPELPSCVRHGTRSFDPSHEVRGHGILLGAPFISCRRPRVSGDPLSHLRYHFFFAFFYRKPRVEVFKEPYWLLAPLIILILFFYREGCFVVVVVFNIYSPFSPWFFWCPFLILPHSPGIFCFVFFLAAVHSFFSLFLSRKVSADLSSVSTSGGFRCRVHRCCDFRSTPFLAPTPLPPSPASSCTLSRFSARAVLH